MQKNYSLTKQSLYLMIGKGGGYLITFFIPLIVVRLITPFEFGTYKQFFLIFATILPILQFGITQSIWYFVPDNEENAVYITQSSFYLLLIGAVALFALNLFPDNIAQLINNSEISQHIPLLAIFLCFMLAASYIDALLISESRIKYAAFFFFFSDLFKSLFILVPLYFTRNLSFLFLGAALFAVGRFLYACIYSKNYILTGFTQINAGILREQFAYSYPLGFASIVFILSLNLHSYFVSYFFSPEIFAIFAVGLFLPPVLDIIEGPIIEPMFVAIMKALRTQNTDEVIRIWHSSVRKISLAMFPIVAFCFVAAKQIITLLFTEAYLASVTIFMIAIFRVFFAVFIPENIIKAHGETKDIFKINLLSLCLYTITLSLLIRYQGVIGAAIAMIFNEFLLKALLVNRARSLLSLDFVTCVPWMHLTKTLLISFISTIPVVILSRLTNLPNILFISVSLTIFAFFYSYLVWKSSLLTEDEKTQLYSFFSFNRFLNSRHFPEA